MQFVEDENNASYKINKYDSSSVTINEKAYKGSLIVSPHQLIEHWKPTTAKELKPEDFDEIIKLKPEVFLLGTGISMSFVDEAILAPLYQNNILVEVMGTPSACRTFTAMSSDGRDVVAGLII